MNKPTYQDLKRQSELGIISYCRGCKKDLPLVKFNSATYYKSDKGVKTMCKKCTVSKPFSKAIKANIGSKRYARALKHQLKKGH